MDAVNLSADQQAFLKDIPDPMFRQTARDFMVNQQFRRDYWVKGPRRLSALTHQANEFAEKRLPILKALEIV
ncbi:MAG: hypothetical protein A3H97_23965 [Acidobacteria bacterium RIFCSPLOWO2_02_FULL_65_29]|nr:MAG: hypothetical protein A3H97_23965 [Acidobacteria bacterium RIFCSPLOWO2_02_FULL_65_29]